MIRLSGPQSFGPECASEKVLRVTTNSNLPSPLRHGTVLVTDELTDIYDGFHTVLSRSDRLNLPTLASWASYLNDGDIVYVSPVKSWLQVLYRKSSPINSFLVTERCSSNCVMCSQPPKAAADDHLYSSFIESIPMIPRSAQEVGITGGEPLLNFDLFIKAIERARAYLPETALHVLTNGRLLAYLENARRIAKVQHPDLMFGIPLYSDLSDRHDFVVQARGAFDQTIRGIINMQRLGLRVEVRFVLHRLTVDRVREFARFIARNLPFVEHVAFMGLEHMGYVKMNFDALWVDPVDYADDLDFAVQHLSRARIRTSIYNLPLCVLPKSARPFAQRSISDWKNDFLPACDTCAAKSKCAGFFSWNLTCPSRGIHPLSQVEI